MATRRQYRKGKQSKRKHRKQTQKASLNRAKRLHLAFGKQRALAFASR